MTRDETGDSVDLWRQVASAVEYIAAVERPGFTIWDAVADAVQIWLLDGLEEQAHATFIDADVLRTSIERLMAMASPIGAPGGSALAEALSAAMTDWLAGAETRHNQGRRFESNGRLRAANTDSIGDRLTQPKLSHPDR